MTSSAFPFWMLSLHSFGTKTMPVACSAMNRWVGGTQATRFNVIMGLPNTEVIKALATFLDQAFKLRAEYLAIASLANADVRLVCARARGKIDDQHSDSDSEDIDVFIRIDTDEIMKMRSS